MDYFNQESERLRFRKLTLADIPTWVAFFEGNDRLHFLGMDTSKSKELMAQEWVQMQLDRYKNQGYGHLAVERKDTGEFIGMSGILPRLLDGRQEYEIGYSLIPKYWGMGYATEMARTLKAYGQAHIDTPRFISIIAIENEGSMKVARKNGMRVLFKTAFLGMVVEVFGVENN